MNDQMRNSFTSVAPPIVASPAKRIQALTGDPDFMTSLGPMDRDGVAGCARHEPRQDPHVRRNQGRPMSAAVRQPH